MDGHFDSHGRFSGNGDGFHRHSQSNHHHLGFDFAMMQAQLGQGQQTPADAAAGAAAGAAYESHDDLCVDRCMGVGLYNGFQQFNHRGGPPALQNRWTRDNHVSHVSRYDFPMGFNDMSMQFRTPDPAPPAPSPYQQQWYGHQLGPCVPCTDDDCESMADSCCDSECTMTDKCTNVACADTDDACTDQTCPARPDGSVPTSEVVSGAAALISINHAPGAPQHQGFNNLQHQVTGNMGFGMSSPPQQNYMLPSGFLPDHLGSITNHLLSAHGDTASMNCAEPCPLDDPQIYQYCHMPLPLSNSPTAFNQFGSVDADFREFVECGAQIRDAESFLAHFNSQHRPYFSTGMPNLLRASTETQHNQHALASTEAMSPPATPLDTSDSGRSSGTPSPLTPLSNSVEMTDVKPNTSLHLRSISVSSSAGHSLDLGADEEHRCLWREEGNSRVCGQVFADAEDLFKHASETHIKHAQKGVQGFRCGWDDCPRSDAGAAGFPQRSKIERHMQTHIGHKPHICPTCNKGFSAKQALTQHMFIHSNEKPLVCNICHKAFRYPSALTMHQRVHSGLKPLKCPVCGKGFSESSNLSKHKRTHEVKGRFTCTVLGCDRNFHRQDQLRRHMKTHQKEGGSRPMTSSASSVDGMFDQLPQS